MHPGLEWLRERDDGRHWLEDLPRLVDECAERWSLRVGEPFEHSYVSLVLPAERQDGERVVLKIQFPDRESEYEAAALRAWNGDGAVRLLDEDADTHSMLLERCMPGTHLREASAGEALDVLIGLLPRLWLPAAEPFRALADEASWWASYLPETWDKAGRPFEQELFDAAMEALGDLPATQGEQVLVHQDLHADNVLAAQRERWLVIDPKPLLGEREFALAPIIRSDELGGTREDVLYRFERLVSELGLNRERTRRWAIAQTIAWGLDDDGIGDNHLATARHLLEVS